MVAVERISSNGNSTSSRPPPLTQTDAVTSLLSLSIAAAGEVAVSGESPTATSTTSYSSALDTGAISTAAGVPGSHGSTSSTTTTIPVIPTTEVPLSTPIASNVNGKHHRRLGSTGQTRRRLSDAREATARPILAATATATSSAALSLASLSLSTSPPVGHAHTRSLSQSMQTLGHGHSQSLGHGSLPSYSYTQGYPYHGVPIVSGSLHNSGAVPIPILSTGSASSDGSKLEGLSGSVADGREAGGNGEKSSKPISISASANGKAKKRGVDYRCESCAKIYRHPNCLNKHRWEHTRQWREASKFVLSKHQQVQLLEAATILSFMGTTSTSLPDDRSEWPSFLSGGSLPKTEPDGASTANAATAPSEYSSTPVSSGLGHSHYAPQQRTTTYALQPHLVSSSVPNVPAGPRMHDYALPAAGIPVKVTQVRPGLLGVPTNSSVGTDNASVMVHGSPTVMPTGDGGWSLPSSALRSNSYGGRSGSRSRSRSGSGSRSDESLDIAVDIEGMDEDPDVRVASVNSAVRGSYAGYPAYGSVGLSNSPGYGYAAQGHAAGYGYGHAYPGRRSVGMKREEDEMSVGFSVREEDEEDEEEDDLVRAKGTHDSKWDGMEMELDMDMD